MVCEVIEKRGKYYSYMVKLKKINLQYLLFDSSIFFFYSFGLRAIEITQDTKTKNQYLKYFKFQRTNKFKINLLLNCVI